MTQTAPGSSLSTACRRPSGSRLLWRSQLRFLRQHRLQTLLAILGIALSITVVVAVDLTKTSAQRSFETSYQRVMGSATHQLLGGSHGLNEALYRRLRMELRPYFSGLEAAPVIQTHVHIAGRPQHLLQLLAVDPIAEAPFRSYLTQSPVASATPSAASGTDGNNLRRLLTEPGTALLSAATAQQLQLAPGDQLQIDDNGRQLTLKIIDLIGEAGQSQYQNLLLIDIGSAQQLLQRPGQLDRIDLKLPRHQLADVKRRLLPLLPAAVRLEATAAGEQHTASLIDSFQLNLQALSLLTLLVGVFLIHNTINSFVLQRQLLYARLRALGVQQSQLVRGIFAEAALLAVLGLALGLPLGIGLSHWLLALTSQTINDHYYTTSLNQLFLSPLVFIKASALGLGAATLAAALPAYQAKHQTAGQQLRRIGQEQPLLPYRTRAAIIIALLLCGAGLSVWQSSGLIGGFAAVFCLLLCVALLTQPLLKQLLELLSRLCAGALPLAGRMALRDTRRNLSRTGIAAMALLIAVASANGIGVMIESFRGSLSQWLLLRVNADAYVRPVKTSSVQQRLFVPEDLIQAVNHHPTVHAVSLYLDFPATALLDDGRSAEVDLVAAELPSEARAGYRFLPHWGQSDTTAWQAFERGELLIAEPLANRLSLQPGDTLQLQSDQGAVSFSVGAIYYDFGSVRGRVLLKRQRLLQFWDRPGIETLGLYFDPHLSAQERDEQVNALKQLASAAVTPVGILRNSGQVVTMGLAVFDRTFSITQALRLLVLAVALIGIVSALSSLQLERQGEMNSLRALGFSRGQLLSQQLGQALLLGLFVGALAIPLGQLLAWMLLKVINLRAFGWTMALQPHWLLGLQNLAFSATAAVLAALVCQSWRNQGAVHHD